MKKILGALLLGACSVAAQAATITLSQTLDLNNLVVDGGTRWFQGTLAEGNQVVNNGDTIDLTIDFAGNQTLQVTNPGALFAVMIRSDPFGGHNGVNASVQFFNPSGPLVANVSIPSYSGCCHHLGPVLGANQFTTGPGTIEFSGLRMVTTVSGFGSISRDSYKFWVAADSFQIGAGSPAPTPEPAAIGLLGAGLAGLAVRRRRKLG